MAWVIVSKLLNSHKSVLMKYAWSLLIAVQALAADPISDALQKGLFEEEANHNLDAAIKAYQSVIDQTAEQRKLTATAVFRLGECYRKLNKTNEAVVQYQRVYREFSDHTNLLALSQQALKGLGTSADPQNAFADRLRSIVNTREPEDPQAKEIARLKTLANDSPDLLSAKDGQGSTSLHWAAEKGYMQVAEFLLSNKVDVNRPNTKRSTPLHAAVWAGHKPMVELLLTNGADINAVGGYEYQANSDNVTPYGSQPLHMAVYKGNQGMVELLLNYKADVNGKAWAERTPLHFAVEQGFLGIARFLISKGANVDMGDHRGRTPAMVAAAASHDIIFRALMESGADVNAQNREGHTLTHLAARERLPSMLKTVLERKPNLEIEDKQQYTPLMAAIAAGYLANVELLLQAGANPNHQSENGLFPLYVAYMNRRGKETASLLLAYKADPNLTDLEGRTVLSSLIPHTLNKKYTAAERNAFADFAELLRKHGARETLARVPFIGIKLNQTLNDQYIEQDGNGWNHYTLFELIHFLYSGYGVAEDRRQVPAQSGFLQFPDFSNIRITHATAEGEAQRKTGVDLSEALRSADCAKDVRLQWGDLVNIMSADYNVARDKWAGLIPNVVEGLSRCLERQVTITVKGETRQFRLRPKVAQYDRRELKGSPPVWPDGALSSLRLKNVLNDSGMLRASSDTRRVKVKRTMPNGEGREIIVNAEGPSNAQDLLLRDGDAIHVPEKS